MFYEVLTILFFTSTLLDILYQILSTWAILKFKTNKRKTYSEGVSVIIAAKNEYKNLQIHLSKILAQDYPVFEVIVVNDKSTDDSILLLDQLSEINPKLKALHITETPENYNSKKFALQKGIEAAVYPLLLFTDADCYPVSDQWIKQMVSPLNKEKEVVLGVSPFIYTKNSFFNDFQQFENITTAISYLFFAIIGLPYMGVGRNLLYRKETFLNNNGFENIEHIKGGDDDLFLQKIMTSKNTAVSISTESLVYTYPKETYKEYLQQKMRHYGVGVFYKIKTVLYLSLIDVNKIVWYLLFIILLNSHTIFILLSIFILRLAMFLLTYNLSISKLYLKKTFKLTFIICDSLYILQRNLIGFLSFIFNSKKW